MISNPSIANKSWIYEQYDHEVGTRTVLKPGSSDAAVIRLADNKFVSVKLDGNSKHCYLIRILELWAVCLKVLEM